MKNGGTKQGELDRSAYRFQEILQTQGIYYALMFLVDSGYGVVEIKEIAEIIRSDISFHKPTKLLLFHGSSCMCPASFCCPEDGSLVRNEES